MGRHAAAEPYDSAPGQAMAAVGAAPLGARRMTAAPTQGARTTPPLSTDVHIAALILGIVSFAAVVIGTVQALTSRTAPAFYLLIATGLAFFLLILFNTPAARLGRAEAAADKEERQRAAQRAFLAQLERNYRMEVELGWRPATGYDVATEACRFSSGGAFNGLPRPAIWSYSDGLGGAPIRTPGGAVGVLNRRYGPLTPVQWAGVAAVAAWGLEHHHRR
ncbi:hypothetical protein [Actinomycetospora termitidis]|uniref:Uncharacterized protein n=1 Tax=Actinomycetospora termitidis TaxID=3053470 RepID=A0ABT7MIT7_9PSEU|nr:hypothetical protein [Actinomycetospora sp. Odt1-22]MDL5160598.1 hypothetical protein [Actinomycetospora sp. Odt1-22]